MARADAWPCGVRGGRGEGLVQACARSTHPGVAFQCRPTDVHAWRAFVQAAAHRETAVAGTPVTSAEVTERSARTTTRSSIWDQEGREKILLSPMVAVGAPRGL